MLFRSRSARPRSPPSRKLHGTDEAAAASIAPRTIALTTRVAWEKKEFVSYASGLDLCIVRDLGSG